MKKSIFTLFLILLGLAFSGSFVYAEMAKEGSGEYRSAKSATLEVLPLGEGRFQMNYDEKGAVVEAPENSPFTNASFHSMGTLHAIKGKFKANGAVVYTCHNGDQIFGVYETEGEFGKQPPTGLIKLMGGTGECTGITGEIEILPGPALKASKEGTYQSITIAKVTWKIP